MKDENQVAAKENVSVQSAEQKNTKKTKKDKKPNLFKRMGRKIKEVFSELKKVSWPTFPKIVKQTGVVLAVVVVFLVIIAAFDFGLSELLKLLKP